MNQKEPALLCNEAVNAYKGKRYAEAANLYGEAAAAYRSTADVQRAAEMDNNRSVALLQNGDAAGALQAAQGTDAIFAQSGNTRAQAMAFGNQAAALEGLGKRKEALARYQTCSQLLKSIGETEQRSVVLARISELELRKGRPMEAMFAMEFALDNKKKLSLRERFLKKLLGIPFQMIQRK